jgi:hypothetical protein
MTRQINACRAGAFPKIVKEVDEDESPHMNTDETDEEAQDTCPAFDDNLDSEVDDFTIEEDDRIFMVMVHPVDPHHFVRALSTVSRRLAEAFAKNSKPKGFEDIVLMSLHSYADVLSETAFDSLPEHRKWDHAIELEREPSPGFRKVYPMTLTEQTEMDAFLEEALATGRIRQSKSPLGAPVFFIKKKDGKLRFIQDYQALNVITRKNRYLLPLIDDLIHRLKDARYFTKLDVRWGYNNVRICEGNEWKAAFRTNRGLFEPLVMYFGLTNSPATFQTMMNEIFQDLITKGIISIYLDDILIFTNSLEEHRRITCLVVVGQHVGRVTGGGGPAWGEAWWWPGGGLYLSLWAWGSRAVVMVVGHPVRSLDGPKRKSKKKQTFFFFLLVSILGAVSADTLGQVVGHI